MCGIFAAVSFSRALPSEESSRRALDFMRHRGPDRADLAGDELCTVGATRLSITGSVQSEQPLQHGPLTIALNGEIYNYRFLRDQLIKAGASILGDGDTEVVLHAFSAWGPSAFRLLDGMFAIAIWNSETRTLTLARDRFGEKPLSYAVSQDGLRAASEVHVLVNALGVSDHLDVSAILDLSTHWYIDVPKSIYSEVRQVPPGHVLECRRGSLSLSDWRAQGFLENAQTRPANSIDDALRSAMESMVPRKEGSALLLSSGIDSGLLASYAAELNQDVVAITTSFTETDFDESLNASRVASSLGLRHHVVPVDLSTFDLPMRVNRSLDEPLADASVVAAFAAASAVSEMGIRIVLGGDGGDELFGGYPTYSADEWARVIPGPIRTGVQLLGGLSWLVPNGRHPIGRRHRMRQFAKALKLDPPAAHSAWRTVSWAEDRRKVFAPVTPLVEAYDPFIRAREIYAATLDRPWMDRMLAIDQETWLPGAHLRKMDRAFMAYGIETRAPFLSRDVWSISSSLPTKQKADAFKTKKALRDLAQTRLPLDIARLPKRGWTPPTEQLMRERPYEAWDLLSSGLAAATTERSAMKSLWRAFLQGNSENGRLLWALASLSMWGQTHQWSLR